MGLQNEWLLGITETITTVIDFVITFFKDFISLLKVLAHVPQYIITSMSWIPSDLLAMVMVIISAVILYKILGREG